MKKNKHTLKVALLRSTALVVVFFVLGFLLVKIGRSQGTEPINKKPLSPGMLELPMMACATPLKSQEKPLNVSLGSLGNMISILGSIDDPGFYKKAICTLDKTVSGIIPCQETYSPESSSLSTCETDSYGLH